MSNLMTSDLIQLTRDHCLGSQGFIINTLAAEKSNVSVQATLTYPIVGAQVGQTVEIGWVQYSVIEVNPLSKQLSLLPVVEGTAVIHPAGSRVTMSPRFPAREIIRYLNIEMNRLTAAGIFKLRTIQATAGVITPPVDAQVILGAWNDGADTADLHHEPVSRWKLGDDPDGVKLVGPHNVDFMVFGCTLGEFSYTTDIDVSTTGLVNTAEDLPPLGAAVMLLAGREAQRNLADTQGETRRAGEVPSGAMTGTLRNLLLLRAERVSEEVRRLQQRYGLQLHARV